MYNPHLPQAVAANFASDFQTLRWNPEYDEQNFPTPELLGQSMMKQYLWAQDMLGGFHNGNEEEIDPNTATPDVAGGFELGGIHINSTT